MHFYFRFLDLPPSLEIVLAQFATAKDNLCSPSNSVTVYIALCAKNPPAFFNLAFSLDNCSIICNSHLLDMKKSFLYCLINKITYALFVILLNPSCFVGFSYISSNIFQTPSHTSFGVFPWLFFNLLLTAYLICIFLNTIAEQL